MKYIDACECEEWSLVLWEEQNPAQKWAIPFRCRSWRHGGVCRQWRGAQDFLRISQGMKKYEHWLYIVLTFKQHDWPDKAKLYRHGVSCWSKLRQRITRKWGPVHYVQTWEKHEKGGPHVNIAISNKGLFEACAGDGWKVIRSKWLNVVAEECGFGYITWLEPMRGYDELAGYFVKLARELTGSGIKSQIPEDAPRHFRRLRASRGLLPPPYKDPLLTGKIAFTTAAAAMIAYQAAASRPVKSTGKSQAVSVG